jgi:hypothetical protein
MSFETRQNSPEGINERMRIDSSGNVGIGTTSPNGILELKSTGNTNFFITAGNTSASQVVLGDTDDIDVGKIAYSHNVNSMEFIVNASERMRINSSGDVLIGLTATPTSNQGGISMTQDGVIFTSRTSDATLAHLSFHNTNGQVGTIKTAGSSTSFNTSSDYRLKENVSYDFDATTRLKQLKPARFNFIADADTTVDGFIAHEVQSIVPEAISGEKDAVDENGNPEYQGIDQSKLVPLLVKTIQELEARITTLEANNP